MSPYELWQGAGFGLAFALAVLAVVVVSLRGWRE